MDVINTEVPGKYPGYFCIIRVLSDSNKVRSRRAQGPARSALNQGPQDLERPLVDLNKACENSGHSILDDFAEVSKIVEAGATSKPKKDYELSRYACATIYKSKINEELLFVSNYSFCIYLFHEFNLIALKKVFAIIIPQTLLFQFIEYLGIPFIILLFCLILCIILEKYMPGLYNLISGGRRDIKVSNYCDIFYR